MPLNRIVIDRHNCYTDSQYDNNDIGLIAWQQYIVQQQVDEMLTKKLLLFFSFHSVFFFGLSIFYGCNQ